MSARVWREGECERVVMALLCRVEPAVAVAVVSLLERPAVPEWVVPPQRWSSRVRVRTEGDACG